MQTFDIAPFSRSSIGFDRLFDLLETASRGDLGESTYPPYNIEKLSEDAYRITMAVAGFDREELQIVSHQNTLTISGRKKPEENRQYLHRGLAARAFQRHFNLADFVKVSGAGVEDGLLTIDLVREVPEAMKPRNIEIAQGTPSNVTKLEARTA